MQFGEKSKNENLNQKTSEQYNIVYSLYILLFLFS